MCNKKFFSNFLSTISILFGIQTICSPAFSHNGFYIRGEIGYALTNPASVPFSNIKFNFRQDPLKKTYAYGVDKKKNAGTLGRITIGYYLTGYFGLETGLLAYPRIYFGVMQKEKASNHSQQINFLKANIYGGDLMLRMNLFFKNFYISTGGGLVYNYVSFKQATADIRVNGTSKGGQLNFKVFAGLGYRVADDLFIDVQYSHLFPRSHSLLKSGNCLLIDKSGNPYEIRQFNEKPGFSFDAISVGLTVQF